MQVDEIKCSLWVSITKCHFHITSYCIWQNYVCFGDFLGKRTLCDAYHKEHASAFLDTSDFVRGHKNSFTNTMTTRLAQKHKAMTQLGLNPDCWTQLMYKQHLMRKFKPPTICAVKSQMVVVFVTAISHSIIKPLWKQNFTVRSCLCVSIAIS